MSRVVVVPAIAAVLLSHTAGVQRAVESGRDIWGDALLRSPQGPTYDGARRYLRPLRLARGPQRTRLTASGVYYLALGEPDRPEQIALHVADGSQIIARSAGGPSLTVFVNGRRFDSQRARLYGGFYPVLETNYAGVDQESFAARVGGAVDSFVRLRGPPGKRIAMRSSDGWRRTFSGAVYLRVPLHRLRAVPIDGATYMRARRALIASWNARLARGATFEVPERRVADAERNLLIQNLLMTWRYSLGNPYQSFEFPESLENAEVLGEYGFPDADRAIVENSLRREPRLYLEWEAGSRLLAAGRYMQLFHDRPFLAGATPALARNLALLRRRQQRSGLLAPEKYTADLPDVAIGLGGQAVARQGLSTMAGVWAAYGRPELAAASRATATRLRTALLTAVRASEVRLPDGSLFVPARLLDGERPYRLVAGSVQGSYWNLVVPDALASQLFAPKSAQARGALQYLLDHGTRLLGLVRGGSYALYGRGGKGSGTNAVYNLNVARFLADNDQPDQLVLSLYGQLAAGMTPDTFVSGEAASVTPLAGETARAMYLPPNSTSNAAFLETLRLMLVHELPDRLELAFATPRAWLAPGKRIRVVDAPTRFGRVSYTLEASAHAVRVLLQLPESARRARIALRLRLPHGDRTIDLTGRTGTVQLMVAT